MESRRFEAKVGKLRGFSEVVKVQMEAAKGFKSFCTDWRRGATGRSRGATGSQMVKVDFLVSMKFWGKILEKRKVNQEYD